MLHGYGKQKWLKKSYEKERRKALEDSSKFTEEELEDLEVTEPGDGGGRTNPDTYWVWNFTHTKKVDIRVADPRIG